MSTPRRTARGRLPQVDADHLRMLRDEEPVDAFAQFTLSEDAARELWRVHGAAILREWVRHNPGCRPSWWWRLCASEPRRLISGAGRPYWQRFPSVAQTYAFGLPYLWCGDPAAPPVFESQFDYLKRLGLLLPRERRPENEPHPSPDIERDDGKEPPKATAKYVDRPRAVPLSLRRRKGGPRGSGPFSDF